MSGKRTFGPYPARCVEVHDGDTIYFDIDLGFGIVVSGLGFGDGEPALHCRAYGINAPELRVGGQPNPAGLAALAFAHTLIMVDDVVELRSHGWDKFSGRYDAEIKLPDGSDFSTRMLAAGHAVPFKP